MSKCSSVALSLNWLRFLSRQVPHVHMHIIPRRKDDYPNNDDIYEDLDERNNHLKGPDNETRKPRSAADMKEEADQLRALF